MARTGTPSLRDTSDDLLYLVKSSTITDGFLEVLTQVFVT